MKDKDHEIRDIFAHCDGDESFVMVMIAIFCEVEDLWGMGSYRVSLKKRSLTRLAPKPLHKALLVLKMVHNDEDQSKTL